MCTHVTYILLLGLRLQSQMHLESFPQCPLVGMSGTIMPMEGLCTKVIFCSTMAQGPVLSEQLGLLLIPSPHPISSSGVIPRTVSYTTRCFSQSLQSAFIVENCYIYVLVLNQASQETVLTSNSPPSSAPKQEQDRLKESFICGLSQLRLQHCFCSEISPAIYSGAIGPKMGPHPHTPQFLQRFPQGTTVPSSPFLTSQSAVYKFQYLHFFYYTAASGTSVLQKLKSLCCGIHHLHSQQQCSKALHTVLVCPGSAFKNTALECLGRA